MGHQNILTLVDYFETMNNCRSTASISPKNVLVPGKNNTQPIRDVTEPARKLQNFSLRRITMEINANFLEILNAQYTSLPILL